MEQDNNQSTTPIIKKSKGPAICSALCIILALAGIGFGVYGMFFNKTSAPAKSDDNGGSSVVQKDAPSLEAAAKLLGDKYGLNQDTLECEKPLFVDLNFDETLKMNFVAEKFASKGTNPIKYEDFNEKYHYYFGSEKDAAKQNFSLYLIAFGGRAFEEGIKYSQDTDSFEIMAFDGFGCKFMGVGEGFVNKVVEVKATEKGFVATAVFAHTGDNESVPKDEYGITKERPITAFLIDYYFVDEEGEYKLVDLKKK